MGLLLGRDAAGRGGATRREGMYGRSVDRTTFRSGYGVQDPPVVVCAAPLVEVTAGAAVAVTVGVAVAAGADVEVDADVAVSLPWFELVVVSVVVTAASAEPEPLDPSYVKAATPAKAPVATTPATAVPMVMVRRRRLARDRACARPLSLVFMARWCRADPFDFMTTPARRAGHLRTRTP
jgi:hypothetical protein